MTLRLYEIVLAAGLLPAVALLMAWVQERTR